MIARTCAAQVARQIVRALHVSVDETVTKSSGEQTNPPSTGRSKGKGRKKKKAA